MKKLLEKFLKWVKSLFDKKDDSKKVSESKPEIVASKPSKPKPVKPTQHHDPRDPPTDWENASVFAMLWKPKRDHGPETVIVAWSNNVNSRDLKIEITNSQNRKLKINDSVPGYYERGHNVHGQYGGINFVPGRSLSKWPKNGVHVRFFVVHNGEKKYLKIDGNDSIHIKNPTKDGDKGRVEVNYKSNRNYR